VIEKGMNVEEAMEAVNRAVAAPDVLLADFWKHERPGAPNLAFLYPPYSRSLQINLDMVSRNWEIESEFELGTRRRFAGRLVIAYKRLVRSMLRWYINPLVHQVRKFNMLVTRTLFDMNNNLDDLEERVAGLEKALTDDKEASGRQGEDGVEEEER